MIFQGSAESGQKVTELPEFSSAQTIKVNPDKPQEEVRFLVLQVSFIYFPCLIV